MDVFFVISGFLITRIIVGAQLEGRFSILQFYERRARRILLSLFTVMLVSIPLAWWVMVPYQLEDFALSMIATLLFVSNILFWFETDYFAVEAASKPLFHTWSLSVEEQFYLFFPVLLILLHRIARVTFLPVLMLLAVVSFAASLMIGAERPSANFFLFPFRAWELLAGAIVAIWTLNRDLRPSFLLAALGLCAVVASFFLATETNWPGTLTLLPVLGTVLLLLFADPKNAVGQVLAWSPVRFVGLIS